MKKNENRGEIYKFYLNRSKTSKIASAVGHSNEYTSKILGQDFWILAETLFVAKYYCVVKLANTICSLKSLQEGECCYFGEGMKFCVCVSADG